MKEIDLWIFVTLKEEDYDLLEKYGYDFEKNFACLVSEVADGIRRAEKRKERKEK